jgi:hypothetical protein
MSVEGMPVANTETQDDSFEDRAARLQDMLDFDIPKLCRWCERAYAAMASLTNPDVPTVEERKTLTTVRKSFNAARRTFAEDGATYFDFSSSDLPYQDDPDAHATIWKATCSANLISLLLSLMGVKDPKQYLPFLHELDNAFPVFLNSHLPAQPDTHELAFRVRCGRLVELFQSEPDHDPLVLATTVFCEQPAKTTEEAIQRLRGGPFREFGGAEQGEDFINSDSFEKHMNGIINIFELTTTRDRPETEAAFNTLFALDDLLKNLRIWAQGMYVRVNKEDKESGGSPKDRETRGTNDGFRRVESESLFVSPDDDAEEESDSASDSEQGGYNQLNTVITE